MSVSFRIMGIPSRMDNIRLLQRQLGLTDKSVFIDTEYRRNPMWTWAKTAMLDTASEETHLCIVQDDAVLPDRFIEICERFARKYLSDVIYLMNFIGGKGLVPRYCIFQPNFCTGGTAIIIPKEYIQSIIEEWRTDHPDYIHDDNWIMYWCHRHGVRCLATYPSVIDTLKGTEMGHDERTAYEFCKDPMEHGWINATSFVMSKNHDWSKPAGL